MSSGGVIVPGGPPRAQWVCTSHEVFVDSATHEACASKRKGGIMVPCRFVSVAENDKLTLSAALTVMAQYRFRHPRWGAQLQDRVVHRDVAHAPDDRCDICQLLDGEPPNAIFISGLTGDVVRLHDAIRAFARGFVMEDTMWIELQTPKGRRGEKL